MQCDSKGIIVLPELQESIDSIVKDEGYVSYSVVKRHVNTLGANYFGTLYEVIIKGETSDGNKETNLFMKQCITKGKIAGLESLSELYVNETFFYNELATIYESLQEKANVPEEDRYRILKSYRTSDSDLILLENAAKKGFYTYHRMNVISLKFAELSLQQLAKFHGLSFVLQRNMPEYFERKISPFYISYKVSDVCNAYITHIIKISIENIDDYFKHKVEEYIPTILDIMDKCWTRDNMLTCCLRHGDYTQTNILANEINGELREVIPIDYQMIHYGSPAIDFVFFIYSCTDHQFRNDHMTHLKNLYYNTLGRFLQYFDMDVDVTYPRREFENSIKERLNYGIATAMFFLPVYFKSLDNEEDGVRLDGKFKERCEGILREFIEMGYL